MSDEMNPVAGDMEATPEMNDTEATEMPEEAAAPAEAPAEEVAPEATEEAADEEVAA